MAADGESFPLVELPLAFAAAADGVRQRYAAMAHEAPVERFQQMVPLLGEDFARLDEAAKADDSLESLAVAVQLWVPHEECVGELLSELEEFEAESEERPSLLGDGFRVTITGPVLREGFSAQAWLMEAVVPHLAQGGVIEALSEQEVPHPFFAHLQVTQLLEDGEYERAIRLLSLVLSKFGEDDDGTLLALLGNCYLRGGEHERAAEAYDHAMTVAQDDDIIGEILTNKGSVLQQLGDVDGAIDCFTRAVGYDQESFIRHYNLGQALAKKGLLAEACVHIARSLELNPQILGHVLEDQDLALLRESQDFKEIVGKYHS